MPSSEEPSTITDYATGLTWELEGAHGLSWREATTQRVKHFNDSRACGWSDWRIPTAEELMTLRQTWEELRKSSGLVQRLSRDLHSGDYVWSCEECSSNQFSAYALNYIANIPEQKGKDTRNGFWVFCVRGNFNPVNGYKEAPAKKEENMETPSFSTVEELRAWLERGK